MKKIDLVFTVIQVPLDYLMLMAAGLVSYYLRYQSIVTQFRPVFFDVSLQAYVELLVWTSALGVVVFAWSGLYQIRTVPQALEEFKKVSLAVSTTLLIIIIAIFLRRELFSSRFIILSTWILAVVFVYLARVLIHRLKRQTFTLGWGSYQVVLIGQNSASQTLAAFFKSNQQYGRTVLSILAADQLHQLPKFSRQAVDEVIVTEPGLSPEQLQVLRDFIDDHHHITLRYLASLYQPQVINFELDDIAGFPILNVKRTRLDGWGRVFKRLFDLAAGGLLLIVFSPLFLIIAALIKLDSSGPMLFSAQRVGQNGRVFKLYKFRSMIKNAANLKEQMMAFNERSDGPLFKMKDDPRVTKVGRWLRRSSLDELPQLFNVIVGQMSLVGPRPHEPTEVAHYDRPYRRLLTIKPGLTGAAQVAGRSQLSFQEEAQLDIFYIENWSPAMDLRIILKTPAAVLNFKKSY